MASLFKIDRSRIRIINRSLCAIDVDTNNLYGWVMSQILPVNDFKWVKQEELSI